MNTYKIGVATDVNARYAVIESSCPQRIELVDCVVVENPYEKEAYLHKLFIDKLVKGEWFSLSEDDVSEIITHFREWEEKKSTRLAT